MEGKGLQGNMSWRGGGFCECRMRERFYTSTDSPNEYAAGVEFKNLDEHLRGKIIRHVFSVQRKIAFSKRRVG